MNEDSQIFNSSSIIDPNYKDNSRKHQNIHWIRNDGKSIH